MSNETRYRLMLGVAAVIGLYTVVWGLAPYASINYPARLWIDFLDWPTGQAGVALDQSTKWFSAIGSGLLGALAIFIGGIVAPALRNGDARTVRVAFAAMLVWFTIDSVGSIAAGQTANAVINVFTLVPILIPMIGLPGLLRSSTALSKQRRASPSLSNQ